MSPVRVLVAEDEPEVRTALVDLLATDPDLELVGATADTDEVVRLAIVHCPDIVVMDVKMPGGGGPEATRRILQVRPQARVVALSAYQDRATIVDMVRAGAAGYVLKGSPPAEIIEAVHRAARGLMTLSPAASAELLDELTSRLRTEETDTVERGRRTASVQQVIDGDLHMMFQPIVDLHTGKAIGVESLARFGSDRARTPDIWLAEASELGKRRELEIAAFDAAVAQLASLPEELFMSVNLSPEVILGCDFWDRVPDAVAPRLVVEITEHAPVDDYDQLNQALEPLRTHEGRLAVDDAGAGFASLRHILLLEADFIKLDRSIVTDLDCDRGRLALTTALIAFASEISSAVIAEGIEQHRDLEALEALGVSHAQGFLLGRPGALADLRLAGVFPLGCADAG